MRKLAILRRSDPYRVVMIALGPGLLAGTVTWLVLGYDEMAPTLLLPLFAYPTLLLWSLPALPVAGLTLPRWIPRRPRVGLRGVAPFLAYALLPTWHLVLAEGLSRALDGASLFGWEWLKFAGIYLTALSATALTWWLYLRAASKRARRIG